MVDEIIFSGDLYCPQNFSKFTLSKEAELFFLMLTIIVLILKHR